MGACTSLCTREQTRGALGASPSKTARAASPGFCPRLRRPCWVDGPPPSPRWRWMLNVAPWPPCCRRPLFTSMTVAPTFHPPPPAAWPTSPTSPSPPPEQRVAGTCLAAAPPVVARLGAEEGGRAPTARRRRSSRSPLSRSLNPPASPSSPSPRTGAASTFLRRLPLHSMEATTEAPPRARPPAPRAPRRPARQRCARRSCAPPLPAPAQVAPPWRAAPAAWRRAPRWRRAACCCSRSPPAARPRGRASSRRRATRALWLPPPLPAACPAAAA